MNKKDCMMCDNSGIAYVSNGSDDFEPVYCQCWEGMKAEAAGVGEVVGVS